MSFESGVAVVFAANFNFWPTTVKVWDLDNLEVRDPNNNQALIPNVWASETFAVFGARDGNLVIPTASLFPGTVLEMMTYTVPADAMNAMGLSSLPPAVVPGAQQVASNGVLDLDWETENITSAVSFSFAEPIDTMVLVYGYSNWHWPGDTEARTYVEMPELLCP